MPDCVLYTGDTSVNKTKNILFYILVWGGGQQITQKGKYRVCQMMICEKNKQSGSTKYWGEGRMGGPWAIVDRAIGERRL